MNRVWRGFGPLTNTQTKKPHQALVHCCLLLISTGGLQQMWLAHIPELTFFLHERLLFCCKCLFLAQPFWLSMSTLLWKALWWFPGMKNMCIHNISISSYIRLWVCFSIIIILSKNLFLPVLLNAEFTQYSRVDWLKSWNPNLIVMHGCFMGLPDHWEKNITMEQFWIKK